MGLELYFVGIHPEGIIRYVGNYLGKMYKGQKHASLTHIVEKRNRLNDAMDNMDK